MIEADKGSFVAILTELAALKPGAKLTREMHASWWRHMNAHGWSLEEFRAAADHLTGAMEFMPNPFHFEQLRKANRATAGEAWTKALEASRSAIQCGHATNNGSAGDPQIDRVVRMIGGYGVIAMCDRDKLGFLERRFAEHYEALQDAEDTREAVPELTHDAPRMRLSGPKSIADLLPKVGNSLTPKGDSSPPRTRQ